MRMKNCDFTFQKANNKYHNKKSELTTVIPLLLINSTEKYAAEIIFKATMLKKLALVDTGINRL